MERRQQVPECDHSELDDTMNHQLYEYLRRQEAEQLERIQEKLDILQREQTDAQKEMVDDAKQALLVQLRDLYADSTKMPKNSGKDVKRLLTDQIDYLIKEEKI